MNPIQTEQLLPQVQGQDVQSSAKGRQQKADGASFAETLRAAQEAERAPEERTAVSKADGRAADEPETAHGRAAEPDGRAQEARTENPEKEQERAVAAKNAGNGEERAEVPVQVAAAVAEDSAALVQVPVQGMDARAEIPAVDADGAELAVLPEAGGEIPVDDGAAQLLQIASRAADDGIGDEAAAQFAADAALLARTVDDGSPERLARTAQGFPADAPVNPAAVALATPVAQKPAETPGEAKDGRKVAALGGNTAKKAGAKLTVHDFRTARANGTELPAEKSVAKTAAITKEELKIAYNQETEQSVQLTLDLADHAAQNITSSSQQAAGANGSTFQQMLANTVQNNAPEFVKAGSIVLKDGNTGSINLVLRPESLGNVKISLSLADKVVSGQITVASREAYEAFKDNIASIKQAFAESGYETGAFDLNFSQGGGQQEFAQDAQSGRNDDFGRTFRAERTYGDLAVADADTGTDYAPHTAGCINIVA